jgi:hypothetical protein
MKDDNLRRAFHSDAMRKNFDAAIAAGWWATVNGNGHCVVRHPDPCTRLSVTMSFTAVGARSERNVRAYLRRAGVKA